MGFFGKLFQRRPDPTEELLNSINRSATLISAPTDHALMKLAEERKGHISLKAVSDEYNRLILEKYGR
jgi:TorA maturation chaperone TorD